VRGLSSRLTASKNLPCVFAFAWSMHTCKHKAKAMGGGGRTNRQQIASPQPYTHTQTHTHDHHAILAQPWTGSESPRVSHPPTHTYMTWTDAHTCCCPPSSPSLLCRPPIFPLRLPVSRKRLFLVFFNSWIFCQTESRWGPFLVVPALLTIERHFCPRKLFWAKIPLPKNLSRKIARFFVSKIRPAWGPFLLFTF